MNLKEASLGAWNVVEERRKTGAEVSELENLENLQKVIDWSKCLNVGLTNRSVAEKISSQVSSVFRVIENTFGITWSSLISDFIATNGSGNITEEIAQKVAAFFPNYKKIKDDIAGELSSRYAKDVTPNVSLSKDSLNAILSQGQFTELPLEFFSVYKTNPNAQGFYKIDEISSTGATVSSDGSLKRYLCTLSDSADCAISGLSLNGVANASRNYNRQVNINNDNQEELNLPLNGKAINAIRTFQGKGVLVWGARTLDGNSKDYRYISVRRTMTFLEQSIKMAAEAFVFAPNNATTWSTLRATVSSFLTNQWQSGLLAGQSADDAFVVEIGLGATMTPNDILDGILKMTVKVAITRPAEFIVITFEQQQQKS